MGKPAYPDAKRLLITADSGGSNGARVKPWKVELQAFANETGLEIQVSHFPPGTSKWNKIEHRLFSAKVIVSLIQATRTRKGLKVRAADSQAWRGILLSAFLGEPRFLGASAISSSLDSPRCSCKEVTSRTC